MRRSNTAATVAIHSTQLQNDTYCKLCTRAPRHSVRVREPYTVPCYFRNASLRPLLGRTHRSTRDMHAWPATSIFTGGCAFDCHEISDPKRLSVAAETYRHAVCARLNLLEPCTECIACVGECRELPARLLARQRSASHTCGHARMRAELQQLGTMAGMSSGSRT